MTPRDISTADCIYEPKNHISLPEIFRSGKRESSPYIGHSGVRPTSEFDLSEHDCWTIEEDNWTVRKNPTAESVDGYLELLPGDVRVALEKLRKIIKPRHPEQPR
jgi:hypothetical protein